MMSCFVKVSGKVKVQVVCQKKLGKKNVHVSLADPLFPKKHPQKDSDKRTISS